MKTEYNEGRFIIKRRLANQFWSGEHCWEKYLKAFVLFVVATVGVVLEDCDHEQPVAAGAR